VVCISGDIVIARPLEVVFDVVAEQRAADDTIGYLAADSPRQLVTSSTTPSGRLVSRLALETVPAGTRVWWSEDLRLGGWSRLLLPVLKVTTARSEQRRWARLKDHLEASADLEPATVSGRSSAAADGPVRRSGPLGRSASSRPDSVGTTR
jgi:hypothetical protein